MIRANFVLIVTGHDCFELQTQADEDSCTVHSITQPVLYFFPKQNDNFLSSSARYIFWQKILETCWIPRQLRFLISTRRLLDTRDFCNVFSHYLPTDKVDAGTCKVLAAVNDPLEERNGDDDGECDDAVVYDKVLVYERFGVTITVEIGIRRTHVATSNRQDRREDEEDRGERNVRQRDDVRRPAKPAGQNPFPLR